ncbi:MAG: VacJ family lipoprotein [Nitrococcus sp.]|nr:VacJ family lipoprotein [Nitrococcus sp.]
MSGRTANWINAWRQGLLLLVMLLAGCAANPPQEDLMVYDPLEPMNRKIFAFNEQLDRYVLHPAAQAWEYITPAFVRESVGNFFSNVTYPGVVINDILQGKTGDAGRNLLRFVVNSTLGIGGLLDPASAMGLRAQPEDFGQTFAAWGSGPGPYLVLPLLGPSNFRDTAGLPGDFYSNALTFIVPGISIPIRAGLASLHAVNTRARFDEAVRISHEAALDRYAFIRSAYQQQRLNAIYDGNPPLADLYDESLFYDEDSIDQKPPADDGRPAGESSDETNEQPPTTGQ